MGAPRGAPHDDDGPHAPYLRYYATRKPLDEHGVVPAVLVVFDDDLAGSHFLRLAEQELRRAGVRVPLWVSQGRPGTAGAAGRGLAVS